MKLLSKIINMSNKALDFSSVSAALFVGVVGFAFSSTQAQNISIGGAQDCDTNAVMRCGASSVDTLIHKYKNGDAINSPGSIKNIYNQFGISEAEVLSMNNANTKVVKGVVTKNNVVIVNGQVVATSALTGGRCPTGTGSNCNHGANELHKRQPSQSFISNSLEAYVVLNANGEFKFAIIAACGNPVTGHPVPKPEPKKPAYTIEKEVKVKGATNFQKNVNVKSGTHVIYRIAVKSVGQAPVQNATIRDTLPAHVKYVNNTLKRDGDLLNGQADRFFSNGLPIVNIAPGDTKYFTFEGIVGPNDKPATCKDERLTNVAKIDAPQLPPKDSNAVVNKDCKPVVKTPHFSCESLQGIAGSRVSYTFKAKATAINGAKITAYQFNFGDGQTKTVSTNALTASTAHSYPNLNSEKNYTATVTVVATVNGKTVTHTAPACAVPVKVAPMPAAECTELKLTVGENRAITAQASVSTTNGAKLVSINYDFDDGTNLLVNNLNPVNHTYGADGDYLVKANVTFNIDGQNVNSLCQAPLTFTTPTPPTPETPPTEGAPTCEELAVEDESIVCEAAPTSLVNTGPGQTAAMFAAVTIIGTLGYRMLLSRRLSQF